MDGLEGLGGLLVVSHPYSSPPATEVRTAGLGLKWELQVIEGGGKWMAGQGLEGCWW